MGSDNSEGDSRKTAGIYVLNIVLLALPSWLCLHEDAYLPYQQILSIQVYPTISGRKVLSDEKLKSIGRVDGQFNVVTVRWNRGGQEPGEGSAHKME